MSPANLSVPQLKSTLIQHARVTKERMAPLLYYLKQKLKKQGSRKGEGFAAWVKKNLPITTRTADRWLTDWAVENGLMKSTSRQKSRSPVPNARENERACSLLFSFEGDQRKEFDRAVEVLGADYEQVIFDAVTKEAEHRKRKGKVRSTAAGS
jgi:hypothetical protein